MSYDVTKSLTAALVLAPLLAGCLATPSDEPEVVFEHVWSDFDTRCDGGHVRLVAPDREMSSSNHVYLDKTMDGTYDEDVVVPAVRMPPRRRTRA